METLAGRVALITGAGRGIGAATARLLAANGVRLGLASRRGENAGIEDALARECDVRDPNSVQEMVDATVARFGRLDIVVANAGSAYGPFSTPRLAHDEMIDVNLGGSTTVRAARRTF